MKKLMLLMMAFVTSVAMAQEQPVTWTSAVEDLGGGEYRLEVKAEIQPGWHIYDMAEYELGGPVATVVKTEAATPESIALKGDLEVKGDLVRVYDDVYEMEIGYY
ncbi:MAG: hypothetical protein IJX56_03365, partial [Alistipes sp.]|nr:hypothetical protein [Alistipes sp.]